MAEDRAQQVTDTFIELADTLASDYDTADFLHTLVERCESVLRVDAGGVLLEDPDGTLNLVAATSETMARYEQAEMEHDEGPCIDAYRQVEQVVAADLNAATDRWPHATAAALKLGMQAVYAFPLRLRGDCIGALNLYRSRPGPFEQEDIRLGQAFADMAAIGILQAREVAAEKERADRLQGALDSRVVIEQAKGVLVATQGISPDQAFAALRSHARSHRMKLHDVCLHVVQGQSPPTNTLQ